MADLHSGKLLNVEDAILYVLLRYWDPLRLQNDGARRIAYERYVGPLREVLLGGPSMESLAKYLHEAKVRDFGVVGLPRTRERGAAVDFWKSMFTGTTKIRTNHCSQRTPRCRLGCKLRQRRGAVAAER